MTISTIVFDFGNVLGFFSHHKGAEQLAEYSPLASEDIYTYLYQTSLEHTYDTGKVDTSTFLAQLREKCQLTATDEQIGLAFSDIFTRNDELCDLVPKLRENYRLVLLSNTNDMHARYYCRQFEDVLASFDRLIFSHEVGCRKPDPEIFEHCEQILGVSGDEILFLDDMEPNIVAASERGWHGIVYRPDESLPQMREAGIHW